MTDTTMTAGAKCAADISALLRARNPLIWCVTREEARAERLIIDAAAAAGYVPMSWDCAAGITNLDNAVVDAQAADPGIALATIRDSSRRQAWIMRDLHAWLRDPTVTRALRSLCRTLPNAPRDAEIVTRMARLMASRNQCPAFEPWPIYPDAYRAEDLPLQEPPA